jgi:hypothetical protein
VVVVPAKAIDQTLTRLAAVKEAEAAMLARVKAGLSEVGFVADLLKSDRVRRVD